MAVIEAPAAFKKGDKVRATVELRGVPEGTRGRVRLVNGFAWIRYWVSFENGVALGSIDGGDLVADKDWDSFVAERELTAALAEELGDEAVAGNGAAADADAGDGGGDGAGDQVVNGVVIPGMLLERSRLARERLGA